MPRVGGRRRLRAVGITCGIGSMLVGARQAGFDVVGNVEWRRYYHRKDPEGRNSFLQNFPGAFMGYRVEDLGREEIASASGCDLAIGHPECGLYSQMQGCNNFRVGRQEGARTRDEKLTDVGDIPLFLDLLARLRPRFFVMDDLPKSFLACPMEEYHRRLPDYDLFPERVSNWHYGNIQLKRVRMFMVGSLRSERWAFAPGESDHDLTLSSVLSGLPVDPIAGEIANHDPHTLDEPCGRGLHMDYPWHRPSYADLRDWFARVPEGTSFRYYSPHASPGETKMKPGWYKARWSAHAPVIDGGSGHIHPLRNLPFTLRERCRIQGFPDDFVLFGTKLSELGEWNHERNIEMVKQTGKAMPVQFCRYVSDQIAAHILGRSFESSGERLVRPDPYVDEAKRWYCENVGYSDQERACDACWMKSSCEIRTRKYGMGTEGVQLPPAPAPKILPRIGLPVSEGRGPMRPSRRTLPPPGGIERVEVERGVEWIDPETIQIERVEVAPGKVPEDYHCRCRFCSEVIGELIRPDGTNYSRLDRRRYYDPSEKGEGGHVAKTPLHVARWAVQEYTQEGDWVLDPTAGAGTTLVEALVQGRSAVGVELEFGDILLANVRRHVGRGQAVVGLGDARSISEFLGDSSFKLIQNNPPYFGDQSTFHVGGPNPPPIQYSWVYDRELPSLGLLREGPEYWDWIRLIYGACTDHLERGGRFVVAVKDQMRNRSPDGLHEKLGAVLESVGLVHEGTAFLRHHPTTLHLNTYYRRYGVHPPYYQTILVFRRPVGPRPGQARRS